MVSGGINFEECFLFLFPPTLPVVNLCNSVFLADARYLKIKFDDVGMMMIQPIYVECH